MKVKYLFESAPNSSIQLLAQVTLHGAVQTALSYTRIYKYQKFGMFIGANFQTRNFAKVHLYILRGPDQWAYAYYFTRTYDVSISLKSQQDLTSKIEIPDNESSGHASDKRMLWNALNQCAFILFPLPSLWWSSKIPKATRCIVVYDRVFEPI